ncbi:small T antigen [Miniopterus schreibersii polyomavirus 1]|uniref:Small T antigen n=1 Tax=Miniopterus schreibersii polyomavirus 1 TaxID=1904408 RepID=A0A1S7J007_9POLY|nr:small T antigen [Miniopterus schreibersii polyomavirus 1]BAX01865.1 small T antigen [Miniopterus schreibersii polyomavirus 1]BAX01871.1 small T antigen [Miniopterus schreibersii polyomavirus 1]BAX01877.1 small T antigen [Miniopterus schreibersii polyomavirus 1]
MDRLLEKKEREQLVELLEVHPQAFYNVPIMKTAFKKACKKWHPDKGGDTTKMTLLNSLWQRYQQGVIGLRSSQVRPGQLDIWDVCLEQTFSIPQLRDLMLKSPQCLVMAKSCCTCIASTLINQHLYIKKREGKKCLVWGECFCIFCFALWFGAAHTWETFELWAKIIAQLPKCLLLLHLSVL